MAGTAPLQSSGLCGLCWPGHTLPEEETSCRHWFLYTSVCTLDSSVPTLPSILRPSGQRALGSDFQTKYVIPLAQIEEVIFQVILKEKFEEFWGPG